MPWTVKDVDEHKKGLSDKQKKQWVSVANSILKKLMGEGKSEKEAAASAIRQANGAVNIHGGEGSGNFGHSGRPGQRGGSDDEGDEEYINEDEGDYTVGSQSSVETTAEIDEIVKMERKKGSTWKEIVETILDTRTGRAWFDKAYSPENGNTFNLRQDLEDAFGEDFPLGPRPEPAKYSQVRMYKEEKYKVSKKKHEGKDYLVVPVTMMVEGVHNGSHGPLLHEISELGKFPEAWNGIPVVIDHPEKDGVPVSANSPEVLEECSVGKIFNTKVVGEKLRAEAWLDSEKLEKVSIDVFSALKELQPIEVSVGVFTDDEEDEGDWKNEHYTYVAKNHRPDHLAILPNAVGACSLADGCGIRANKGKDKPLQTYLSGSYLDKESQVRKMIEGWNTDKIYNYFEDMNDMFFVYCQSGNKENKIYRQEYRYEGGKVLLVEDPVEVQKKVDYVVTTNGMTRTKFNNLKEEDTMPKNDCPKCVEKVNALIANKHYEETDREWLSTLSETALDKVAPKVIEKVVEKTIEVNKLAPEDQAALAFGKKQMKERREGWIRTIQANAKDIWTEEKLKVMDDETLEGISKSVHKEEVVDYTLNGGSGVQQNAAGIQPLLPVGVEVETKK